MKTIAWDVDDVLNDLMGEWLERGWRREHPACTLALEAVRENPPHRLLGASLDEYLESLDRFRLEHADALAPLPDVLDWFEANGARYRHVAVTAVPRRAAHVSAAWVARHFGRWIRGFFFVPSPRADDPPGSGPETKLEVVRWIGAAALVDDNPAHVGACRDAGVDAFLVPRPWNGATVGRADVLRSVAAL